MADCVLLPLDTADYTVMGNGSVSVRFPVRYRGVYSVQQYTYIAGKIDRRLVSFRLFLDLKKSQTTRRLNKSVEVLNVLQGIQYSCPNLQRTKIKTRVK